MDALKGASWGEVEAFYPGDPIRQIALAGIHEFVSLNRGLLTGRTLDFGCGKPGTCRKPQPYRDLVAGEYVGVDVDDPMPRGLFDAVLCTEVAMYLHNVIRSMNLNLFTSLKPGGRLLLTWTAAWPEIEPSSLWRFTASGMHHLLDQAGFSHIKHQPLAQMRIGSNTFVLGHGVTAVRV